MQLEAVQNICKIENILDPFSTREGIEEDQSALDTGHNRYFWAGRALDYFQPAPNC